jgi:polygalacturonase
MNLHTPHAKVTPAKDFEVIINGEKAFVHHTSCAAYVNFSFSGVASISVVFGGKIYDYKIRPVRANITSNVYRNQLQFEINRPLKLSVEFNNNIKRPLFIFANPIEKNVPNRKDPNVMFFAKDSVYEMGTVVLKSNQTVYIEGGAVVKGSFLVNNASNVKITGRGILDNSHYMRGEARPIEINQSKNVTIEGIIINESKHWSCGSYASENVTYNNLKIVSDNDWDDGIDIVGSQNIKVQDCFIRTKDDCIAVKSGIGYFTKFDNGFNVKDIVVENSVLWNGVWGNALEIGFETRCDSIDDVTFKNIDIIHTEGPEGTFTIHNGDRAVVSKVLYENIHVEDARGLLIDFKILNSRYSKDKERGKIRNVLFRNITVEGDQFPSSVMIGFDEQHNIDGVTLEKFSIHGKKIKRTYDAILTDKYTQNLSFKP